MFPNAFFGGAYFAARYFPKVGAAALTVIDRRMELGGVGFRSNWQVI